MNFSINKLGNNGHLENQMYRINHNTEDLYLPHRRIFK
jgi:hypothetical protein